MFIKIKLKLYTACITILFALLGAGQYVIAVEIPNDAENRLPDKEGVGLTYSHSLGGVITDLAEVYQTPVCFENPLDLDIEYLPEAKLRWEGNSIEAEETLGQYINSVLPKAQGDYVLERNHSMLCIVPLAELSKNAGSKMLMRASLHLENASTWDALKTLLIEANKQPIEGREIHLEPSFVGDSSLPPDGFMEPNTINLHLEDVTFRDALCAILEASPVKMSYTYYHPGPLEGYQPYSNIYLEIFYEKGIKYHYERRMTNEEQRWWDSELVQFWTVPEERMKEWKLPNDITWAQVKAKYKSDNRLDYRFIIYGLVACGMIVTLMMIRRKFKKGLNDEKSI